MSFERSLPKRAQTKDFWNHRRVLVTGLSGFIGGWLALTLADAGADVVGIVRDSTRLSSFNLLGLVGRVHLVQGTLTDFALVERVINEYEVEAVFHLAAQAIVGTANRSPLSTFESNIKGTWIVLEVCRQSRLVRRIVVASSDKAYGAQQDLPYTENSTLNGVYPYDASKVCTDVLAQSYAITYDLPVAITRCSNVYGGADLNWSRLIPGTIRTVLQGEKPIIRTDGTPERDYIFTSDAVAAYLILGKHSADEGVRGQAFNFGSGRPVSALGVVQQIIEVSGQTGLEPDIQGVGKTHGEIDRQYLDSRKARRILGWHAEVILEAGLKKTVQWYMDNTSKLGIFQTNG